MGGARTSGPEPSLRPAGERAAERGGGAAERWDIATEVRITGYTLGFARFGDHWLATVSIDFYQIEPAPGRVVLWPPEKDVLEAIAAVIGTGPHP